MKAKSRIIQKLEERHQIYVGLNQEEVTKDQHWRIRNPMGKKETKEWIEYGVNTIMSEMEYDRTKAEIEMSWIEASYTTTIKQ
jgi:hypothetical protein